MRVMAAQEKFRVIVAGAGIAGLFMAEMLKRAGIDFTVYEKAGEVGGTWRDNTYPGLFVDVLSRQYEFPFQPNYDWSRKYAPAGEIQAYIKKVAAERDLRKYIRFNEEIVSARFLDGRWHLATAKGAALVADVFVAATGFLNHPVYPAIEGRETFAGPSFHSARWDHSVPHRGKSWGVIGSGCSGVQITEALAWEDVEVTQFIRRAQWIHIRENPQTSLWHRLWLRLPGAYRKEQRKLWQFINVMDQWRLKPGAQRDGMEREFASYLDVIADPELKAKLTPAYKLGCTRIPKSDQNYYAAVQLPNVTVENRPIRRIVPQGVEFADGTVKKLDVLVYATGFDTHAYMRPMEVVGLGGATIARGVEGADIFLGRDRAAGIPEPLHALRPVQPGQQRAGAAGARAGDRRHPAPHRIVARRARRGGADRGCDAEIRGAARRGLPRHRLGRLQELVLRPARHADPVAAAAGGPPRLLRSCRARGSAAHPGRSGVGFSGSYDRRSCESRNPG